MLEFDHATKRFGPVAALDECTFVARPGRLTGFLGPNGAGKTTAMRAVFGLLELDAGTVRWQGELIAAAERARFGYMPEERGLYPRMRVRDQLVYLGRLCGLTHRDVCRSVDTWLERLGLSDRARDRLDALSHGNQQRVQLIAALVNAPSLLVLDEPFSGLDPIAITAMGELLAELATAGVDEVEAQARQWDEQGLLRYGHRRVVPAAVPRPRHGRMRSSGPVGAGRLSASCSSGSNGLTRKGGSAVRKILSMVALLAGFVLVPASPVAAAKSRDVTLTGTWSGTVTTHNYTYVNPPYPPPPFVAPSYVTADGWSDSTFPGYGKIRVHATVRVAGELPAGVREYASVGRMTGAVNGFTIVGPAGGETFALDITVISGTGNARKLDPGASQTGMTWSPIAGPQIPELGGTYSFQISGTGTFSMHLTV